MTIPDLPHLPLCDAPAVTEASHVTPSSEDLVAQVKAGGEDAFQRLVKLNERRIFNYVLQLLANRQDAEDVTLETFIQAHQQMDRYNAAYSFATWLFIIAKRRAISHYRANKPRVDELESQATDWNDPAAQLMKKEEQTSLWNLAKRLKSNQREALWLRYGEGFSIAEIASIMRTNVIRVKVLLYRARHQLAQWLRQPNRGG